MRRSAQSANAAVSRRAVSRVQLRSDRAPLPNCSPSPRAPRRSPSGKPQPASLPPQDHSPETPSFWPRNPGTRPLAAPPRAWRTANLPCPGFPLPKHPKSSRPILQLFTGIHPRIPPNRPSILKVGQAGYPWGPPATEPSSDTRATDMSTLRQIEANRRNAQKSTGPTLCHRQNRSHTHPARRTRPAGPPAADSTPFTQSYFTPNWLRSVDPHSPPPPPRPPRAPAGPRRAGPRPCRYPARSGSPHWRANGSFPHFHAAHSQPCTNRNDGEWFRKLKSAVRNDRENHSYVVQVDRKGGGCVQNSEIPE